MQRSRPAMHTDATRDIFATDRVVVWLSIDDAEWAMGYLFTQNQLKGVPLVASSDAGPGAVVNEVVPVEQ